MTIALPLFFFFFLFFFLKLMTIVRTNLCREGLNDKEQDHLKEILLEELAAPLSDCRWSPNSREPLRTNLQARGGWDVDTLSSLSQPSQDLYR